MKDESDNGQVRHPVTLDPLLGRRASGRDFEGGGILSGPVRLAAVLFLLRHVAMRGVLAAALHRLLVLGFAATYHPPEERTRKRGYDRPDHGLSAANRPCRTHISFLAHPEYSVNRVQLAFAKALKV